MSQSTQTIDSLLASLVGMGFELHRCQAAVNCGKLTVNDAIEWLLQGPKSEPIQTRSAPTLSLNPAPQAGLAGEVASTNYLPFSLPPVQPLTGQQPTASPADEAAPAATVAGHQPDVVSRFSLTDSKRQEKERWEREQREKATIEARQARQQAKQARNYVLKNIEADKEARNLHGKRATTSKSNSTLQQQPQKEPGSVSPSAQSPAVAPQAQAGDLGARSETSPSDAGSQEVQPSANKPAMCMLQIRFPCGSSRREPFASSANLQSVVDYIQVWHPDLIHIHLIQPFPHRLFTPAEMGSSLQELKLTPSGNLVVKLAPPSSPAAPPPSGESPQQGEKEVGCPDHDQSPQSSQQAHQQQAPVPVGPPNLSPGPGHHRGPQLPPAPFPLSGRYHSWGKGHTLSPDSPEVGEEEEEEGGREVPMEVGRAALNQEDGPHAEEEEEEMEEEDEAGLWGPPLLNRPGMRQGRQGHNWGDGIRLLDGRQPLNFNYGFGDPDQRQKVEELPSPQRAAEAALSRLAASPRASPRAQSVAGAAERPVPTLVELCLRCVCRRIEGRSRPPISTLEALPPDLASRLLNELKTAGTLRPKTLNLFLPCHLQHLGLDCYKYATNELLQAARLHVHISRLSLSACPLLTDQAFQSIGSLKKLQYLDVSNNKQLTDRMLFSIKDLYNLVKLVLEGTSVSDGGIGVLASSVLCQLTHLSLNRTNVTDGVLAFLAVFYNLKSVGLEQTRVASLSGIQGLLSLQSLNLARNSLTVQALSLLIRMPRLAALNVMLLEGLEGDQVLQRLQGLELKQLQLPDRHTTTDVGLCSIAGMPLLALDLSDYIHITDEGVHHIADMTSLTKLSLNNTKITDKAMTYIQGLVELRELHLDRTAVSDEGAVTIGELGKLEVLSMAETRIKNAFLQSKSLNRCQRLTRLNLSRTDVTDIGIGALQLPHLSLLNLDSTCVTMECAGRITGCPQLKVVRTNNLRVYRGEGND